MRKLSRFTLVTVLISFVLLSVFVSCPNGDEPPVVEDVAVTSITLDKSELVLEVDKTVTLVATVLPNDATNKAVVWSSSADTIAEVDEDGVVTAKAVGEATITVTTDDGKKTATCGVTVVAEDAVALIGTTGYTSLEDALDAVGDDETLTLLKDVALSDDTFLVVDKKITIDGNGKEVTGKTTAKDAFGLFTFGAGSEGSTLKDLTINFTSTGRDGAAVYFTYGFTGGTSSTVTTIENVDFVGASELESIGEELGVSSTYIGGGYVDVKNNTFTNFKYAIYFNQISNANITGNTIDGTAYNAINIAADNTTYPCENITITGNVLKNISYGNYNEDVYAAGIRIGLNTDNVSVEDNDITMLHGKPEEYWDEKHED